MNRVAFLTASDGLRGTNQPASPIISSAAGRPGVFPGRRGLRALAFILTLTALCGSQAAPGADERQALKGHVPAVIHRMNLQSTGALSATNRLHLAIGLPLRNRQALDTLLGQIYDPASPNYRKYLTPEQFTQQFGPTEEDYQAVVDFARTSGLEIVGKSANRMILDVKGASGDIEKAFQVKLRLYAHPKENRTFFAPDVEPSVPAGLAVLDISGLNNYARPHPNFVIKPGNRAQKEGPRPFLGSGPDGNYFGYDFRDAYAPGVTLTGAGQTLALVEFDGYFASDIADYNSLAGLPNVPLQNVLLDGFDGQPTGTTGESEVSLDIELANAMAPNLSRIISYEGNPDDFIPNDVLNAIATDDTARQISCSWGWSGGPSTTTDQIHLQMNSQGQSFFQASGDSDSLAPGEADDPTQDFEPCASPYATSVGATTLTTTGPLGSFVSETVWQWGDGVGSTGGISSSNPIPTWQKPVNMSTNGGSTTNRNFPDVAMVGDNIFIITYGGEEQVGTGGTSCAAPLWAAFTALMNQKAMETGSPAVGFLNPTLYPICLGPLYTNCLHDVTNGNNFSLTNTNQFVAVPGYDLCTGFGSPAGQPLINAFVPATVNLPVLLLITNTLTGGNGDGKIDPNECKDLSALVTNLGVVPATHVQGILSSLTPGVLIGSSVSSYPDIPAGGSAANQTPFTVSTEPSFICGTTVNLQLVLKCDQTSQTNYIQYTTGSVGSPVRFNSSAPLVIDDLGEMSPIVVSNISTVGKVTVSLYMTTTYAEYMYIYLISPNDTIVELAYGDGGLGANFGTNCYPDSARTTFDDSATNAIYNATAPCVGTFSPEMSLSEFNFLSGANVNGTWELFAEDLLSGYTATLHCWSLFISPEQCAPGSGECPGSDLSIAMSASPITVPTGGDVIYTLSISNAGPSPATNSVVNMTLPAGMSFAGAALSQGTVQQVGSTLIFSLGTVGIQNNAYIVVTNLATAPGLLTTTATVGSPATDPNPDNNTASISVLVTKPDADLALSMSVSPTSVPENGHATFSIYVTNNGPATALGVTVTNLLPANVNFISGSASQGTVSSGGTVASIGTVYPGSGAMVQLVLSPTVVGTCTLTSTVGLQSSETDPVLGNNTASQSINVVPAADLGVSAVVLPSPAISGGNVAYIVTVTNIGPANATSVIMNQTLPTNATYVSTSRTSAIQSGGVVTWSIGSMPAGTSQTLTNIVQAQTLLSGVASNVLVSTFNVFGQPADPNTNNNFASASTVVLRPQAIITLVGATLTSEGFQPPNGAVNPGETVGVQFELQNVGNIPTTNLTATLQTNGGVFPVAGGGVVNYHALAPGGGVGYGRFTFTNNGTNGGTVVATLQLQDGQTNLGTVSYTFLMPVVSNFWTNQVISIPAPNDVATNHAAGPAGPYPSSNLVSGINAYVSGVTVTVSNLNHSFTHDINMLLVGPGGQSSILMCGAANYTYVSNATITFDQNAPLPVPQNETIVTGSYQPAEYNSPVFTNVPGISPPYNTNLNIFAGAQANGWWSLYVYDGTTSDYGAISNGWGLAITTLTPVNQITDVGVAIAPSANQVVLGSNVSFTITVTNLGTNATAVVLTNVLGAGLAFVSNTLPAYAPFQVLGQTQYYNLGVLPGQTNLTLGFVATATAAGVQSSTAIIGSSIIDPNTNNNQAVASVTVSLPAADVAAGISSSAAGNTVVVGTNVLYTLVVTNNGPDLALNVIGVLTQGVAGSATTVFSNNFGSIVSGSIAAALFSNAPAVTGPLTNTWTVSTADSDPIPANNTQTLVLAVTYPEPVIVTNGVKLLSESFSPPDGAIDSNETVTIAFTLENTGVVAATNLIAALQAGNGVFNPGPAQNYGTLSPGASATQAFAFTGRGAPGSVITAVLSLTNNGAFLGTVSFPFTISTTLGFTNSALITIPDEGPGTPYPAVIAVSTAATNLVVAKVTAILQGFTHSFPHDVNVLLTSPSGQQAVLMAHAGGPYSVTNLVLNFDGNSANALTGSSLISGTSLPTQFLPLDYFPGISGRPSNTNLSVFNGVNPNGLWSLYVYDDTAGNSGNIANGWSLSLTLVNPVNQPGSLAVAMTNSPALIYTENYLTFQITVTNLGPTGATNVILTDTPPAAVSLVSAAASQGSVITNSGGTVTFNLGILTNAGDTATATLKVQPLESGSATNSATAGDAAGAGATAANTVTVINGAPFFLQATNVGHSLKLTLNGSSGQNYVIQVSTNLTSWTNLSTNTAIGAGQFIITNSLTNASERFYRALHWPQ